MRPRGGGEGRGVFWEWRRRQQVVKLLKKQKNTPLASACRWDLPTPFVPPSGGGVLLLLVVVVVTAGAGAAGSGRGLRSWSRRPTGRGAEPAVVSSLVYTCFWKRRGTGTLQHVGLWHEAQAEVFLCMRARVPIHPRLGVV